MPSSLPPRPRRAAAAVVVAAVHVLIGGATWQLGVSPDRSAPPPAGVPLAVRLLLPEPAQRPATRAVEPAVARTKTPAHMTLPMTLPMTTPTPTPQTPRPNNADAREPQAITLPLEPAATHAPLNLALPRAASAPQPRRNPVLDDPRANTARATLESRIAGAMGGTGGNEGWFEERLDDDRVRFRRGSTCIEVQRSRDAQLDPFNQSFRPTPRLTRPC